MHVCCFSTLSVNYCYQFVVSYIVLVVLFFVSSVVCLLGWKCHCFHSRAPLISTRARIWFHAHLHLSFIQTRQYNNNHLSHKFWIREINLFFPETVALSFNGLCCEITKNIPLCRSFDMKRWFFGHHLCIDLIEYQI